MQAWKRVKIPTLTALMADPKVPLIHRDLSWLQFNERVLAEARPDNNPTLKKLKFLSISASNLDEFFMIRFANQARKVSVGKDVPPSVLRIFRSILDQTRAFAEKQTKTLRLLKKQLDEKEIYLHAGEVGKTRFTDLTRAIFLDQILPHLEIKSDFRWASLSNLNNLQCLALFDNRVWIEIPKALPHVFSETLYGKLHFFFLDEILLTHLPSILKHEMVIFRLTRDADFTVDLSEEDSESIPEIIKSSLGGRDRGRIVRLQYNGRCPAHVLETARKKLKLHPNQIFAAPTTLYLHGLFSVVNGLPDAITLKPGYNNPPLKSMVPTPFMPEHRGQLFENLNLRDFVLHHPYDSYDAYVNFIQAACEDPLVTTIEQTIYRTDSYSHVMELLESAAKKKKVRIFLELRARFDEWNNLRLADELRQAGVEVGFGFGQLKLHAKICLVTRKEDGKDTLYTHLSTGNYNAKTARAYTDIAIVTGRLEIGQDARHFFDSVMHEEVPTNFKQLVTAPTKMHQKIRTLIHQETRAALAGKPAHIVAKVNALVDEHVIEDLYNASCAGVRVDLIVRGACSLIPGVKGLSENIRVISIVDRFLEHSRIYYFGNSGQIYLSSADWMPRNFFSRLEIAFPVLDPRIYTYIVQIILPAYLNDTVKARELTREGTWKKIATRKNHKPLRAQSYFEELANNHYQETVLYDENPSAP